MWRVGTSVIFTDQYDSLNVEVGFSSVNVVKFWRLEANKSLYYSREYTHSWKTNNYTTLYERDGAETFGFIKFFLELQSSLRSSDFCVIAVVDELSTAPFFTGSVIVPHLHVIECQQQAFIPISYIRQKCILIDIGDNVIARPFDFCAWLST